MKHFTHRFRHGTRLAVVGLGCVTAAVAISTQVVFAEVVSVSGEVTANADSRDRGTAVALNFCRASFHRIRKYPTADVMQEEREKILNNLDLNGIADPEVIKLYTSVLDEIGQIQIAEHEKKVVGDKHRDNFRRRLGGNTVAMGLQVASGNFLDAVRTGANSWWDYRDMRWNRDFETWRVDKTRMTTVVNKSSDFLDTFWKLAQAKHIPDRWLVRGDDLNRLEDAMREPDMEVRLRILKRMEPFMECYPPYWYYVARAQQTQGQLFAAADTYDKLANLASGHFRRDEMLAAGLSNRAAIQEYLGQPGAERTALEALRYSTAVWEANLMCARILHRHGRLDEAEDAILRNLDVGLERDQSTVALVSLYTEPQYHDKLLALLNDETVLRDLPALVLVQCGEKLAPRRLPDTAMRRLADSMSASIGMNFGFEHVVLTADPTWKAGLATLALHIGNRRFESPVVEPTEDGPVLIHFRDVMELGHPFRPSPALPVVTVNVEYSPGLSAQLVLQPVSTANAAHALTAGSTLRGAPPRPNGQLQLTSIHFGTTQLALLPGAPRSGAPPFGEVPAELPPVSAPVGDGGPLPDSAPETLLEEVGARSRPQLRFARPRNIVAPDPRQAARDGNPLAARMDD